MSEAFKEPANLVGLAGSVALSFALLNPLPLIIGAVAEAAYLLFVPDSKWYEARIQSRFDGEVIARRNDLKVKTYPMVRNEIRQEFGRLEQVRAQIEKQSSGEEKWFREAMRKLDFLMEKYLQFAQKEAQFATYLTSVYTEVYDQIPHEDRRALARSAGAGVPPPIKNNRRKDQDDDNVIINPTPEWVQDVTGTISKFYENEIAGLDEAMASESVIANRNLMGKRQQILVRRREFISRVSQIMTNLDLQMQLTADTFGLINDEIRARSPEQVLSDIDDVVNQATSLTEAIDEITPMTELVTDLA